MLQIEVKGGELFDEEKQEFYYVKPTVLELEHSLISISKWEAKWKKAFLSSRDKTTEQTADYIRCMTINRNVDEHVYDFLTAEDYQKINDYINDPMSAVYFRNDEPGCAGVSRDSITNEVIYHWMITFGIPDRFEKWHLNHLLSLIRVRERLTSPKKHMSKKQLAESNRRLNEERKRKYGTRG